MGRSNFLIAPFLMVLIVGIVLSWIVLSCFELDYF